LFVWTTLLVGRDVHEDLLSTPLQVP
jgi:hypothetical protein